MGFALNNFCFVARKGLKQPTVGLVTSMYVSAKVDETNLPWLVPWVGWFKLLGRSKLGFIQIGNCIFLRK